VTDGTNPLADVTIKVKQGSATIVETTTNALGQYSVYVSDSQNYNVSASKISYITQTKPITISGNTALDFTLSQTQGCVENWQCTEWSACSGGQQTRACTDLNHCGTAINKPAESQSCSSRGSSGDSYSGRTYSIGALTESGTIVQLRKKDAVIFTYNNEQHKVTIKGMDSDSATILIESPTITTVIKVNEIAKFDLNEDGTKDLQLELKSVTYELINLKFSLASTTAPATIIAKPAEKPSSPKQTSQETPAAPEPEIVEGYKIITMKPYTVYLSYAVLGLIAAAILAVAVVGTIKLIPLIKAKAKAKKRLANNKRDKLRERIIEIEKQLAELKKQI